MIDVHIQQIVNGLGLSALGLSRLIGEMSGGQRAKLILAKLLLEKIVNRILDIDNYKITKYYGNYSEFLKKKVLLREDYVRQYTAQQKEIKKQKNLLEKT